MQNLFNIQKVLEKDYYITTYKEGKITLSFVCTLYDIPAFMAIQQIDFFNGFLDDYNEVIYFKEKEFAEKYKSKMIGKYKMVRNQIKLLDKKVER